MLKEPVRHFIMDLGDDWVKKESRLILASLMTHTLSRNEPINNKDTYLYRLYENYRTLDDAGQLEKIFSRNPNFVEKE